MYEYPPFTMLPLPTGEPSAFIFPQFAMFTPPEIDPAAFAYLPFIIFPALMIFAGAYDFLSLTIPNRICAAIAGAFFPAALLAGAAPETMALNASCAVVVLAAGLVMFARGWIGGGDAKLLAAAALWLGWGQIVPYGAAVAVIGGALALVYLALRAAPSPVLLWLGLWAESIRRLELPYGVAIAAAAVALFPRGGWLGIALG